MTEDQLRIEAVKQLKILDTESEPEFDEVVKFVGVLCETPYVVLTMVDTDRLWFKSKLGIETCEVEREISICNHTLEQDKKLEIEDARLHPVFKDNPLVNSDLNIRFYTGIPLKLATGETIGTLCVLDDKPRVLTESQKHGMDLMAKQIVHLLESRRHKIIAEKEAIKTRSLAQKFASLYDSMEDGVVECDAKTGRFIDCNQAFSKMLGYSCDELLAMTLYDVTPEVLHDESLRRIEEVVLSHAESETFEKEYLHQSGKIIPAQVKIFKIDDLDEDKPRVWAQIKDLSTQKKKEEQRAQRKKMESLGTLSGGIAHDFNNILAIISGSAELIKLESNSAAIKSYIEKINSSAKRGADLVNRILSFSGKNTRPPSPILLKPVIEQSLELILPTIPKTISLEMDIKDAGVIEAVDSNITQILINLCSNACQAIEPSSGKITVSLSEVASNETLNGQQFSELKVSDTGSGISKQQVSQIFDPFFTTREVGRGTGLGLAIVHGLVEDMNGSISVQSTPEKGTCFVIRLPQTSKVIPTPKNNVVSQDKRGFNILLVEDEVDIAALYKESLQSDGHQVQVAHDGMSALAKLQASPDKIDIVVTDDQMPKLRGIDFARKLKALYPNTPVVLLSGFVSSYVENSLKAGDIDKYMLKPVSLGELRTSIFHLLFSE